MIRSCLGVTLFSSVAVAASTATAAAQTQIPPSVEFSVPKPPTVALSDSGAFLSYELHVTNLTPTAMYLRRVEVLDAGTHASVFTLADSALIRALTRVAPPTCRPTDTTNRPAVECLPASERAQIPAGVRAYVYLWIPVDANHPPAKLSHRLTFKRTGADSGDVVLEGTAIPVATDLAVISAPFHGEWAAFNGPSNSSGHRRLVLGLDGHTAIGQRFAIDFLQLDSTGSSHHGDPLKNENYYAYGTPLMAVADGVIAATKDSIPQNVPGAASRAVPITMTTVGGNYVAIDIGGGTGGTRSTRTSSRDRCASRSATASSAARSSRCSGTPVTPPSRTCISRSRTAPRFCHRKASRTR